MLMGTHHVAHNMAEAAREGLAAGIDYECRTGLSTQARGTGKAGPGTRERSGSRRWRGFWPRSSGSGLFDNPYVDPEYAEKINNSPEHKKLAAEAARKVIVLLKNDKNLLPLDATKLKSIAVIGPNAADVHLGGYSRDPGYGVSVLDGIKAKVGER